jgi:hypothetical protein
MGQQALLDEHDGVGRRVEGNGAVMAAPAADRDVHGPSLSGAIARPKNAPFGELGREVPANDAKRREC